MCQGYESPCRAVPRRFVSGSHRKKNYSQLLERCPGCIFTRNHGKDDSEWVFLAYNGIYYYY